MFHHLSPLIDTYITQSTKRGQRKRYERRANILSWIISYPIMYNYKMENSNTLILTKEQIGEMQPYSNLFNGNTLKGIGDLNPDITAFIESNFEVSTEQIIANLKEILGDFLTHIYTTEPTRLSLLENVISIGGMDGKELGPLRTMLGNDFKYVCFDINEQGFPLNSGENDLFVVKEGTAALLELKLENAADPERTIIIIRNPNFLLRTQLHSMWEQVFNTIMLAYPGVPVLVTFAIEDDAIECMNYFKRTFGKNGVIDQDKVEILAIESKHSNMTVGKLTPDKFAYSFRSKIKKPLDFPTITQILESAYNIVLTEHNIFDIKGVLIFLAKLTSIFRKGSKDNNRK